MKDEKMVVILNRKLVWKEGCIEYEADEQHAQKVWSGCGLDVKRTGHAKHPGGFREPQ